MWLRPFGAWLFYLKGDELIYKSCKYCGKTHKEETKCKKKPAQKKRSTEAVKLRNSPKWQRKRTQIKKRDCYLCQICIRDLYNPIRKFNYEDLEVHHAVSIEQNKELVLNSGNLITLCSYHHRLCDSGKIPLAEVKQIIEQQQDLKNADKNLSKYIS